MSVYIVGLISSYREGRLIRGAIRSLAPHVDSVYVLDAPIGEGCEGPETDPGAKMMRLENVCFVRARQLYESDAAKRTSILQRLRGEEGSAPATSPSARFPLGPGACWGVWLDGDELLMHGENLRDHLEWIEDESQAKGEPGFKFPMRKVEYDGSVAICHGVCVRVDLIESYVLSLALAHMPSIAEEPVPLGNECVWRPGSLNADGTALERYPSPPTELLRPPLQGEPHILHRSLLRPSSRAGVRMHDAEELERQRLGLVS